MVAMAVVTVTVAAAVAAAAMTMAVTVVVVAVAVAGAMAMATLRRKRWEKAQLPTHISDEWCITFRQRDMQNRSYRVLVDKSANILKFARGDSKLLRGASLRGAYFPLPTYPKNLPLSLDNGSGSDGGGGKRWSF